MENQGLKIEINNLKYKNDQLQTRLDEITKTADENKELMKTRI